jgi:hypothetical protein
MAPIWQLEAGMKRPAATMHGKKAEKRGNLERSLPIRVAKVAAVA